MVTNNKGSQKIGLHISLVEASQTPGKKSQECQSEITFSLIKYISEFP